MISEYNVDRRRERNNFVRPDPLFRCVIDFGSESDAVADTGHSKYNKNRMNEFDGSQCTIPDFYE